MVTHRNWTEAEVVQALALYLRLPFGKLHRRNPQIVALSGQLGRTPSAVALKLTNLAALDESLPRRGMGNVSRTDRRVWAQFLADPQPVVSAYAAQSTNTLTDQWSGFAERRSRFQHKQSSDKSISSPVREGQSLFREMILTAYSGRCAITGNDDPRLLVASHIIGWREEPRHRLNPSNGLCLNALHDRAFDRHMITFDEDYRMRIAPDVPPSARDRLEEGVGERLEMPERFLPSQSFLEHHRQLMEARVAAL